MKIPALQYGDWHARWTSDAADGLAEQGTAVVRTIARSIHPRATSTCSPSDDSGTCEKPEGATNTQTLPIVLGLVIPLTCAIVVFIYLHRRNNKKQAIEDLNDPHKSLDFGFDMNAPPPAAKPKRGKKGAPEMIVTQFPNDTAADRKLRGLSMDMIESPYMLPPGLNGSGESLHSMTRSNRDQNDPYRPVIFSRSSSDTARSPHPWTENGSMRSALTGHSGFNDKSNLVGNAQRMSRTYPDRGASLSRTPTKSSQDRSPSRPTPNEEKLEPLPRSESPPPLEPQRSHSSEPQLPPAAPSAYDEVVEETPVFASHSELPAEEFTRQPSPPPQPVRTSNTVTELPARKDSAPKGLQINVNERPLEDWSSAREEPPPPPVVVEEPEELGYDIDPNMIYTGRYSVDNGTPSQQFSPPLDNRASFLGLRPLPPDHPEENPEQRANRIRSFYKEYFDVNRPNPANAYYEDYDADYVDSADYGYYDGWFDPESGQYYDGHEAPAAPWAQPAARRAMTPPPRGAPRFDGGHDRHYSSMSAGRRPFRGPPPKKKLPPPKALVGLPTPHLLKNDSALFTASDFAPPTSFRQMQNGVRPDSPMGGQRPFSPAVRAYSPLASSFTGLSPIPSPHELRKSGTFTSLDFSPQLPRFRGQEGGSRAGSDAGSIRSARSGLSAMQMDSIRTGAYRVSRIPKQFVTSKEDLGNQLKPKWDLISPA